MADSLIKSMPNVTAPASELDLMLAEVWQSGTDQSVPANNTYASSNLFLRDWLKSLGLGAPSKIINGDMRIDKRTIGSGITPSSTPAYAADRWKVAAATGSGHSCAQAIDVPTTGGFSRSLGFNVGTGASPGIAEQNYISQPIEGLNCYDLGWGTAAARPLTVSFWIKSTVGAGTYSGAVGNTNLSRGYAFTFALATNGWTRISVTIPGDTSGTWALDTTAGVWLFFDLGSGSNYQATAATWTSSSVLAATGTIKAIATSSAHYRLTGVKAEVGSIPTPFVPDDYEVAQAKCLRYFQRYGGTNANERFGVGTFSGTTTALIEFFFQQEMRAAPTLGPLTAANFVATDGVTGFTLSALTAGNIGLNSCELTGTLSGATQFRPAILAANATTSGTFTLDADY